MICLVNVEIECIKNMQELSELEEVRNTQEVDLEWRNGYIPIDKIITFYAFREGGTHVELVGGEYFRVRDEPNILAEKIMKCQSLINVS